MADGPLDADELAAIDRWLQTQRPNQCPRTGTGQALPFLHMTLRDHVRIIFQNANVRRTAKASTQHA
jgi:hypothetical protein